MKISYAPAIHFYLSPTELLTTTIFIVLPFPECHIAGIRHYIGFWEGFPGSSAGKESACSAGDSGSLPGSGRSPGEGIGYPLQYSWVSLVAQTVENPLTIRETRVWFLGWGHPLEKGMQPSPVFLPAEFRGQRSLRPAVHGAAKGWTQLSPAVQRRGLFRLASPT